MAKMRTKRSSSGQGRAVADPWGGVLSPRKRGLCQTSSSTMHVPPVLTNRRPGGRVGDRAAAAPLFARAASVRSGRLAAMLRAAKTLA